MGRDFVKALICFENSIVDHIVFIFSLNLYSFSLLLIKRRGSSEILHGLNEPMPEVSWESRDEEEKNWVCPEENLVLAGFS